MAEESKKDQPEDIESILSDLDAILTDMGGTSPAPVKPEAAAPVPAPAPKPVEVPKPVEAVKPVETVKPVEIPKPVETPKPAEPPKPVAPPAPSIELAPRDGMIKPPEKKPEPPKPAPKLPAQTGIELSAGPSPPAPVAPPTAAPPAPTPAPVIEPPAVVTPPAPVPPPAAVAPPSPVPPPAPVAPPAPAQPVAAKPDAAKPDAAKPEAAKPAEIPADAPREQIRRVAYIHTPSCSEAKAGFAAFLSQAARTISKKPLFLREVMSLEVGASADPNAVVQKAIQAKAVAVLAVVEDWPSAKSDELSDACGRANLLFRAVAPGDAQKKSTAVDVIVDMMLLSGES